MLFRRKKISIGNGYGNPGANPAPINISVVGVGGDGGTPCFAWPTIARPASGSSL
ncbi:MAG: hypothetical protein QGG34_04730 [SAR202 cluster bacterium]|jgi:hypothetical protein|nr:hypothetical protein [SAR202 cluster bacterium]MDP7225067.1 hypothetical protein [SAR202 cluster bacterium]MDP7414569.1 hypothetical protein [SAR202 cluster bacterium]HJO83875.1 hypothetical protein [SAR202 cluster bacterium]